MSVCLFVCLSLSVCHGLYHPEQVLYQVRHLFSAGRASTQADELALSHGACFVAGGLEVAAVTALQREGGFPTTSAALHKFDGFSTIPITNAPRDTAMIPLWVYSAISVGSSERPSNDTGWYMASGNIIAGFYGCVSMYARPENATT